MGGRPLAIMAVAVGLAPVVYSVVPGEPVNRVALILLRPCRGPPAGAAIRASRRNRLVRASTHARNSRAGQGKRLPGVLLTTHQKGEARLGFRRWRQRVWSERRRRVGRHRGVPRRTKARET